MTKKVCLSNIQFFQLCEEIRNKREEIQKNCRTKLAVHTMMSATMAFPLSRSSVNAALKGIGIVLERATATAKKEKSKNNTRTLVVAIWHLYEKLGEIPSAAFQALHARATVSGDK